MYLLLFTLIYCIITRIFNLNYSFAFGIYLIVLSIAKGVFSKELKDVFNFRKTSYMYEKFGFKDSLTEIISLMLVYINFISIDYEPFSILDFIVTIFIFTIVYRFLFWGITLTLRNHSIESKNTD